MDFSNEAVPIDTLPRAEDAKLRAIDPRYFKVMLFHRVIIWLIVLAGIAFSIFFYEKVQTALWVAGLVIMWIILTVSDLRLAYLSFLNKAFAVREHDIIYQDGWLLKSLHVFPFNRIQHCSIDSGVIERRFGLSTLKLYTAGGDDSDIVIHGLTVEQSSALRELIIARNKAE
jgi:uncharacterized protein